MAGSLVRIWSSTLMPPRSPSCTPAIVASVVSGRTPRATITRSAGWEAPERVVTSRDSSSCCANDATPSPSTTCTPCISRASLTRLAYSTSRGMSTWSASSMTVTSKPRWARFSAISRPMNPPPTTTAWRAGRTVWKPEYRSMPARKLVPRSIHSRMARASGTVRTEKTPGRSIPGIGGWTEAAPGARTRVSYDSVLSAPVATSRSCTVLAVSVDADGLGRGSAVDGEVATEDLLVGDQQVGLVLDHPSDVVRQTAVRERHVWPALDHDDLRLLVEPAQPGGAGGPSGDPTHDDDLHGCAPSFGFWSSAAGLLASTVAEEFGRRRTQARESRANSARNASEARQRGELGVGVGGHELVGLVLGEAGILRGLLDRCGGGEVGARLRRRP